MSGSGKKFYGLISQNFSRLDQIRDWSLLSVDKSRYKQRTNWQVAELPSETTRLLTWQVSGFEDAEDNKKECPHAATILESDRHVRQWPHSFQSKFRGNTRKYQNSRHSLSFRKPPTSSRMRQTYRPPRRMNQIRLKYVTVNTEIRVDGSASCIEAHPDHLWRIQEKTF